MTAPDAWEPPPNDAAWRGAEHPQPSPFAEAAEFDEAERLRALEELAGSATVEDPNDEPDDEC